MEEFQALRAQLKVQMSDARDVAAGPGEALDQAQPQWIAHCCEDDRDPRGCPLCRLRRVVAVGADDVHLVLHQLARGGGQGCQISSREADAENELLVLTVAQLHQTVPQAYHRWCGSPRRRQHPNFDGLGALLRAYTAGE